jgi:hypothetical protein
VLTTITVFPVTRLLVLQKLREIILCVPNVEKDYHNMLWYGSQQNNLRYDYVARNRLEGPRKGLPRRNFR